MMPAIHRRHLCHWSGGNLINAAATSSAATVLSGSVKRGRDDGRTLYITADMHLVRVKTLAKGSHFAGGK